MSLLEFSGLEFGFSDERIVEAAGGALQAGEVVGLVGANGCGKTTLIRLLLGELSAERGSVQLNRETGPPAYVSQADQGADADTLFGFVRGGRLDLIELEAALARLHGATDDAALARAGELEARFETLGGHRLDNDVAQLLTGLSFGAQQFDQTLGTLSGGQRQKACIARALNRNARLLVFDEPTNHLDLDAQEFFAQRVRANPAQRCVLLVSHDRWLLDSVCTRTWELEGGALYRYQGNYTRSQEQRRLRRELMRQEYEKQQARIARTEEYIRRNIAGQNTRQAQGRRKLLNRMERLDAPQDDPQVSFALTPALTPGSQLLIVENLAYAYGGGGGPSTPAEAPATGWQHDPAERLSLNPPLELARGAAGGAEVLRGVEFTLYRGERLGIAGPNGCGKSTLLRLLSRQLPPLRGMVAWGTNVELGVFHQDSADLSPGFDALSELRRVEPGISDSAARDYLARFGFSGDDVFSDVATLSGGERSRLSLAKIFRRRPNVLLLDEPTNHLDIYAREALEQLLQSYGGSLVLVTHDRALLDRICDRLVVFHADPAGGFSHEYFRGGYSEYQRWKAGQRGQSADGAGGGPAVEHHGVDEQRPESWTPEYLELQAKRSRTSAAGYCAKQLDRLAARAAEQEQRIAELEQRVRGLEAEQSEADLNREYGRLETLQHEIDAARELIEERFGELEVLERERIVWEGHLRSSS